MLLTVDVGNTHTVLGLFQGDDLAAHWRIATAAERTEDEHRLWLHGILALEGFHPRHLEGVALSSVVPQVTAAWRRIASGYGSLVVIGPGVKTGMPILIDNPREVGADRVANAVAALARYGAPAVVVDFGTSTNFDVVSPDGEYLGGVIAPGLELSTNALVGGTAALRRVELVPPRNAVGRNTVEAIQAGALFGHAGLVDGVMDRIVTHLGLEPHRVATGGLASTIVPHCRTVEIIDEFLTLEGLRLIYQRNAGGAE